MRLVESFTIFGSLASFGAIIAAILIYFFQRNADKKDKLKSKKDKVKALKILIYDEIKSNFDYFQQLITFIELVQSYKLRNIEVNSSAGMQYLDYSTKDGNQCLIPLIKHSTMVMDNYLLNVSEVDDKLIALLIKTRRFTHYFNDYFLVGFIDLCSKENALISLKEYIKNTQKSIDNYQNSYIEIIDHCSDIKYIIKND